MSFPLGVIAYPQVSRIDNAPSPSASLRSFFSSFRRTQPSVESPAQSPLLPRTPDCPSPSLPRSASRWRRTRPDLQVDTPCLAQHRRRLASGSDSSTETVTPAHRRGRRQAERLSRRRLSARPDSPTCAISIAPQSTTAASKYRPIVVPQYACIVRTSLADAAGYIEANFRAESLARHSSLVGIPQPLLDPFGQPLQSSLVGSLATPSVTPSGHRKDSGVDEPLLYRPKHIEIQIPLWAQPLEKQPINPPRVNLRKSVFGEPFGDIFQETLADTLTGKIPLPAPGRPLPPLPMDAPAETGGSSFYSSQVDSSSDANLTSANSSQSSLIGRRPEYESASEAESGRDADAPVHTPPSLSTGPSPSAGQGAIRSPSSTAVNLSGLVCNVHRTTGKQPHSLVGATTTILGDRLYVFGGRRLSRDNSRLTSDLFELDLIKRHWNKIDAKGDVPPPRYFHSVCALGDHKLVCYGGMSPASPSEVTMDGQAEVIVMSDIHIYDVHTQSWTRINSQDSPQGRYAHCATILPSSAVFASSNAPLSAMHLNPSGENPNQGTLGVSLDGAGGAEMVVVGGQDSGNHYIEQISIFNLRSLKWTGTTGMGRSCGAYRSVVCPLRTMSASEIGAGPHGQSDADDEDDGAVAGSPMLIYSNYNFLDVKLELQVRTPDGTLTEKPMQTALSPPGLRFPNGGVIDNHFVVSGTFLTASKQEYALWALDLRTLAWSRIDAGGSVFSQGSWNRGVLWNRRNCFVILGNRKRNLVDDYNNRRINFSEICFVELEAFGLYENPRRIEPLSAFTSASAIPGQPHLDLCAAGRHLGASGADLGSLLLAVRELSDMDFLAIDGRRIPVNSRLIAKRWGPHFLNLLGESLASAAEDTATLRPTTSGHPARNSSITITPVAGATSSVSNPRVHNETLDDRAAPPATKPRLFYLPHTAPTLQALLHYLYTSTLPSPSSPLATPQIFCSMLQLARPYHIDGLLEAVVQRLHDSLDGRNAAAIFNAAAMGAGGGAGVRFAELKDTSKGSTVGLTGGELQAGQGVDVVNGELVGTNGRATRNTLRPGDISPIDEATAEDAPGAKVDDESMSESEMSMSSQSLPPRKDRIVWNGSMSSVVGLQKRGLRGLMEGRRLRERGRADIHESARVGLGIA